MIKALVQQRFDGGMSTDLKLGPEHSFYYARHIDFRKSPTQLTVLPKTVKETGTTVVGLITDMIQLPSGKIVGVDESGNVYSRATDGTWTKDGTQLNNGSAFGMVYNEQLDVIYVPEEDNVGGIAAGDEIYDSTTFDVNGAGFSLVADQDTSGHANTYTTTGTITETSTHKLLYTPTIEPTSSVRLYVTAKGTGNVTVTMHDAQNNTIASRTKTAASLTNGIQNEWTFTPPGRTTVKPNAAEYHFHVTHSGGTATTIGTSTASDFSTAENRVYCNRLVRTRNGFHPCGEFLQYILIGNGRYVAVWEPITDNPSILEFQQHRLVFPSGYEVTSMADYTEFKAFACEKRSNSVTNEFQQGKIFFWDGISVTYNFVIDVPEGAPYSLFSHKNVLYYFAGGDWYAWAGGDPVKLFTMRGTDTEYTDNETYFINYPSMMAVRNGILLAGFPSETNSTVVEHGIYSFGSRDRNFKSSIGYSYVMSTGTRTNGDIRIGCIKSFGDKLFITWEDNGSYGVDIVDTNSDPFASATWESLLIDNERPNKTKEALELIIDFDTLPTGCTVTPKYKIDRAGSWTTGTAATAGDTQVTLNINARYKEIQLGFDIVCTTATPTIYGVTFVHNPNLEEMD